MDELIEKLVDRIVLKPESVDCQYDETYYISFGCFKQSVRVQLGSCPNIQGIEVDKETGIKLNNYIEEAIIKRTLNNIK